MQNIVDSKHEISCGTITSRIVEGQIEILLIKQFSHKNQWSIPKGHMKDNETHEECAIRETKEETGIDVFLLSKHESYEVPLKNGNKKTIVTFLARPVLIESKIDLKHDECEVSDAKWFYVDALPNIQISQVELINSAIEKINLSYSSFKIIDDALLDVFSYAPNVDDWLTVKKELLKTIKPSLRVLFSTRHPLTKKQTTNEFEKLLAKKWSNLTKRETTFEE